MSLQPATSSSPMSLQPATSSPMEETGDSLAFTVQLNCQADGTSKVKVLKLDSPPSTALAIKQSIQDKFSIPICVQTLSYQQNVLSDEDSMPDLYHMRHGDILTVDYPNEADIKKITEIMEWVDSINAVLLSEESLAPRTKMRLLDAAVMPGKALQYDEILASNIFDWLDSKSMVNKTYFYKSGHLNKILDLYRFVNKMEWKKMSKMHLFLEKFCTLALLNFAETMEYRRVLYAREGLQQALHTLLKMRLEFRDVYLFLDSDEPNRAAKRENATRLIECALQAVCNFAELPECQLAIASNCPVMHQALSVGLSDFFGQATIIYSIELVLSLACNRDTHEYLTTQYILASLSAAYNTTKGSFPDNFLLTTLRCYILMIFAQLAIQSPSLLPVDVIEAVIPAMRKFLNTITIQPIVKHEETNKCMWSSILPFLRLLYYPEDPRPVLLLKHAEGQSTIIRIKESKPLAEGYFDDNGIFNVFIDKPDVTRMENERLLSATYCLRKLSYNMALFFMRTKVSRSCQCKVIAKENLEDYFVCLPWFVDDEVSRTRNMVSDLGVNLRLQPPKIGSIVRAMLAKKYFGLDDVMNNDTMELLQYVLQNS